MKIKILGTIMLITIVSCGQKKTAEVHSKEKVVPNIERHITALRQSGKVVYYHLRKIDGLYSGNIDMEILSGDGSVKYVYKYENNFKSKNDTLVISGTSVALNNNNLFLVKKKLLCLMVKQ